MSRDPIPDGDSSLASITFWLEQIAKHLDAIRLSLEGISKELDDAQKELAG